MVKLLKQSSISLYSETQGQRVDYKGTTRTRTRSTIFSNKIIKPDWTTDNILKPKDRTYGERVMTVWGWIQGAKAIRKTVKMVGSNGTTLGAISPRKRINAKSRRWKRPWGAKNEMYLKKRISLAVIHVCIYRHRPICIVILCRWLLGPSAKDDRRQKKMRRDAREIWSNARKVPLRQLCTFGAGESTL